MNSSLKDKNIVIIASGGRTGTTFLGRKLSTMIDDCYSVHEPDVVTGFDYRTWRAIKHFGFYHMILGRALGKTGIRNLALRYLKNEFTESSAVEMIAKHREKYYERIEQKLIIESYYQWFGLLPCLPKAFKNLKIVSIVRDPRSWVGSWQSYGGHFDKNDLVSRFKYERVNPQIIRHKDFTGSWSNLTLFEKLCWDWRLTTEYLIENNNKQASISRLYRFEDIFTEEESSSQIKGLLDFVTGFSSDFSYAVEWSVFEKSINSSDNYKNNWLDWTGEQSRTLHKICGSLMKELGYGKEGGWLEKL